GLDVRSDRLMILGQGQAMNPADGRLLTWRQALQDPARLVGLEELKIDARHSDQGLPVAGVELEDLQIDLLGNLVVAGSVERVAQFQTHAEAAGVFLRQLVERVACPGPVPEARVGADQQGERFRVVGVLAAQRQQERQRVLVTPQVKQQRSQRAREALVGGAKFRQVAVVNLQRTGNVALE